MSCKNCDENPLTGAFYRWKTANIEIIACKEHWLEVREALNKAQKRDYELAVAKTPQEKELIEIIEGDGYTPYQFTIDKIMAWTGRVE